MKHDGPGQKRSGASPEPQGGSRLWHVIQGILLAEVGRLGRRLLRRGERPTVFADYRRRREGTVPVVTDSRSHASEEGPSRPSPP